MSDLLVRGPSNNEELLQWMDPAAWDGYEPQWVWDRIRHELHAINLHRYALQHLVRGHEVEELRRIEEAWAKAQFAAPWTGLIDVNPEKE